MQKWAKKTMFFAALSPRVAWHGGLCEEPGHDETLASGTEVLTAKLLL